MSENISNANKKNEDMPTIQDKIISEQNNSRINPEKQEVLNKINNPDKQNNSKNKPTICKNTQEKEIKVQNDKSKIKTTTKGKNNLKNKEISKSNKKKSIDKLSIKTPTSSNRSSYRQPSSKNSDIKPESISQSNQSNVESISSPFKNLIHSQSQVKDNPTPINSMDKSLNSIRSKNSIIKKLNHSIDYSSNSHKAKDLNYQYQSNSLISELGNDRKRVPANLKEFYSKNYNSTLINDKIKENNINVKEIKDYMNKMEILKRRLVSLEKQKEEIDKRKRYYDKKEKDSKIYKQDKENLRKAIHSVDKEKIADVKKKHEKIVNENEKHKLIVTKSQNDVLNNKKDNYSKALCEKRMSDEYKIKVNEATKIKNAKKYRSAKTNECETLENNKKLLEKNRNEAIEFYSRKAEESSKIAEKFKKEIEELEKLEQESMRVLKEKQKATEAKRIIVNKNLNFSTITTSRSGWKNKSQILKRSHSIENAHINKPFIVGKTGLSDSYYNTHRRGSYSKEITGQIGKNYNY